MSDYFKYYGKHKRRKKSVIQEKVKPKLKLVAYRDYPEKTKLIEDYAKANGQTYSDVIREITDQVVSLIKQSEISDI